MKKTLVCSLSLLFLASCASNKNLEKPVEKVKDKKVMASDVEKIPSTKKVMATPKEMVAQSSVNCTANSDERILAVVPVEQGCELLYTKMGETKTIASASFELSYCEAVQTRISKKLETAGFNCK
jgi:hypothetical protein